ncbi:MAG: RND family transporter [Halodesulfurarchaeum sp.]
MVDTHPGRHLRDAIRHHPGIIVVVFLLLTGGFATGLSRIQMSSGMEQFSEDVEAYRIDEEVDTTFRAPFEPPPDGGLLIHTHQNALSKDALLAMIRVQDRIQGHTGLRVTSTRSPAEMIARELDPSAVTLQEQQQVLEQATPTQIDMAIRKVSRDPSFTDLVSENFNSQTGEASATLTVLRYDVNGGDRQLSRLQRRTRRLVDVEVGSIRVFGQGITDYENRMVLRDSLEAAIPAVILLLLVFLAIAYRDPFDLFLGVVSLGMALVWTFGTLGLLGIPFSQLQVALPPLLLAIGVDFGIHTINRYKEEFDGDVGPAMDRTLSSLQFAFFMAAATTVIGFSANMASGLSPIADFGIAAAVGIAAVSLIFSIFLPAGKVLLERFRHRSGFEWGNSDPLGAGDSPLGRLLTVQFSLTSRLPLVLIVGLLVTGGALGYYGSDVGSSFEQSDMLPPEDPPDYLESLPGRMQPGTYTTTESLHYLENHFETTPDDTVTIYATGPLAADTTLESIHRAGKDPPDPFLTGSGNHARSTSIIDVINTYSRHSRSFARLVARNDRNGNGIPDDNLKRVYDALFDSRFGGRARRYLTSDYREARIVYAVESDASGSAVTAGASEIARDYRVNAIPTGDVVVFQRVADEVFESAISSLYLALGLAVSFLVGVYFLLERRAMLGLLTILPIMLTITFLLATMRYLSIPFNTLTATILSVTVGVGVDYSIHVVHRFVEAYDVHGDSKKAARVTLRGTGGALFGTTVTTASAGVVLNLLSLTPILVQFGLLIALSVTYSFLTSVVALPILLHLWTGWESIDREAVLPFDVSVYSD